MRVEKLDDVLGERTAKMLKIDVEGHEEEALAGAMAALSSGRIRNVLFEDHAGPESSVQKLLASVGFVVYEVGWRLLGPVLTPLGEPSRRRSYEPPNYLATLDPEVVVKVCRSKGWRVLRSRSFSPGC